MKRVDLKLVKHDTKLGKRTPDVKPNITEDCVFYLDGQPIGFYIRKCKGKLKQYLAIANNEFNGDNVPKSLLERSDVLAAVKQGKSRAEARALSAIQMSTIIGSIPPKPHFKRNYPSMSQVHRDPKAKTYIKAMLAAAREAENLIQELLPEQYAQQKKTIEESVPPQFQFGRLFTSSISNYNISAPYHRDTGNLKGCVNVIMTKRRNANGGNLHVPDYGACIDQCDDSILVYPAWLNVHGVTPITPTHEGGYRNSLILYPLKAFKKYVEK